LKVKLVGSSGKRYSRDDRYCSKGNNRVWKWML